MNLTQAKGYIDEYKKAFTMGGPDDAQRDDYLFAKGYLERDSQLSPLLTKAVDALSRLVKQFDAIEAHQHKLLVEGQTLESACKNWVDAASIPSIDFTEAKEVLKELAQEGGGQDA